MYFNLSRGHEIELFSKILNNRHVSPMDFYNHRTKTFKKNKRKQAKKNKK